MKKTVCFVPRTSIVTTLDMEKVAVSQFCVVLSGPGEVDA